MELKINEWNDAYLKGGNMCFWPNEEIIRFVSKYIKKRIGIDEFAKIRDFDKGFDLGCGIGRHVKFLGEMGFDVYGMDLSDVAINKGKQWMETLGESGLAKKMVIGNILDIPFESDYFDFIVSHGVFDSMSFEIAIHGIKEVVRVLKTGGLMYCDLIMDPSLEAYEEIVKIEHEYGTVQSYFDKNKVDVLLGSAFRILEFKINSTSDENNEVLSRRAHVICEKC
ncbi:class I SAM-dependent methyltransferase [Acetobacterium wieringae]|uniref:class I SAM-dependent methyltransferase n=1 Tax=Acetobacterium wieringae TaxID=52694 RepID=UPI002B2118BF|nr:class I SAM-dependent methyltransferase [Acetobacterium wieringae]MEA4804367.1 class I SAM-dependent methyltransferase [Acetobacterium wieringae]